MRTPSSPAGRRAVLMLILGLILGLIGEAGALLAQPTPALAQSATGGKPAPAAPSVLPQPADGAELIGLVRHRAATVAGAEGALLASFYAGRTAPLWISAEGLTPKAELAIAEIARADDWGLAASEFALPRAGDNAPPALADAEVKLSLAVLAYARSARGGRVDLANFSRNVDQQPSLADPKAVLEAIAASDAPGGYLLGLHPKHPQFLLLRQALIKLRAEGAPPPETAAITLPDGPLLKPGMNHPHVALLRQRLRVAAGGADTLYDPALREAVTAFQRAHKMPADGIIGARGRAALNAGGERHHAGMVGSAAERLVLNMERWRWMPEELGAFHVWDNVPEFLSRVLKQGMVVHSAKIVAGKPDTQTVVFSANMRYIVFHPEWGVPDSIKVKEILPYLRPSSGDFFGLFGADTRILQRHNLKVSYNGHPIDASQVNWGAVDVRRYSFVQPAGASNVLGVVKFRFPNRHDIYMHDTPQRELFEKPTRAFSHGCIRVQNPGRLAELLLAEDKGWPPEHVQGLLAQGYNNEIALEHEIPVHVTYFTAVAEEDGNIAYFTDIYGLDERLSAALHGRPLSPEAVGEDMARDARRPGRAYRQTGNNFFSGLFGN